MENKNSRFNLTLYDKGLAKNLILMKEANGLSWDDTITLLIGQSHAMRWTALELEAKRVVDWAGVLFQDRPDVVAAISAALAILLNPRIHDAPALVSRYYQDLTDLQRTYLTDLSLAPLPQAPSPTQPKPGIRNKSDK